MLLYDIKPASLRVQNTSYFNFDNVHSSWHSCLNQALQKMDRVYLEHLQQKSWLPGPDKIFNAFSLPVEHVHYILLGESPYPRQASANGYAFWDAAVSELWSSTGMNKKVNRATSLRNMIKMLLVAESLITPNTLTQEHIACIDKSTLVKTNAELFHQFLLHGFLLLNASLVLQSSSKQKEAQEWNPFLKHVLLFLIKKRPNVTFLLLGKIANTIQHHFF